METGGNLLFPVLIHRNPNCQLLLEESHAIDIVNERGLMSPGVVAEFGGGIIQLCVNKLFLAWKSITLSLAMGG